MTPTKRHIFHGMKILHASSWLSHHAVIVDDAQIKAIIPDNMISHHLPAELHQYDSDHYLIPGLIDLHIHGAKGKDVMDASEEALATISQALAEEGVTGFLATTMTDTKEALDNVLGIIPKVKTRGAEILGIHLEGPFIAQAKIGAHLNELALLPNVELIKCWQEKAEGTIKLVTLAPELTGAMALITTLTEMGIIASIGHSNATYDETSNAIVAGCKHATHLFNAMRGLHQREPGTVGALLLAKNVISELIVDGIHLHPAIVDLTLRLKGKENILLVTDAMQAKCLGDGTFKLGAQNVEVKAGKASLADGTLAGSTLTMPQAIKNMVQFSKCSLIDAIEMASLNPARALHLDSRKGTIAVGKEADLVVLDSNLDVRMTMRAGVLLYFKDAVYDEVHE